MSGWRFPYKKCEKCGHEYLEGSVCHGCVAAFREKHPCATLEQVGDEFDFSRERARQILALEGARTSSTKRDQYAQQHICSRCGKAKELRQKWCPECTKEMRTVLVTCAYCGQLFPMPQYQLIHKIKKHGQELFFCTKEHFGKYMAEHHGFKRIYPPEVSAQHSKDYREKYRREHKEEQRAAHALWAEHGNEERFAVMSDIGKSLKNRVPYEQLYDIVHTTFPELFGSTGSFRQFLHWHPDRYRVDDKSNVEIVL